VLCHRTEILVAVAVEVILIEGDCTISDRLGGVGDDQVGIELHAYAKTVTFLAGPEGAVEGEHCQAADGAGHAGGVDAGLGCRGEDTDQAAGFGQGSLHSLNQPGSVP